MDLDQLRYFQTVAARGGFTAASEDLGVSQPALSRSIARLEAELRRPVFERGGRTLRLTDAGSLLLARSRQALSILEDTKAEIAEEGGRGRVRLGAIPTVAPYFLPAFLSDFAAAHPEAAVTVREDTTDNLLKALTAGEVDAAVLALPVAGRGLEVTPLFEEDLLLVAPAGHPLATKKEVRTADIEGRPLVMLGEGHCLSDNIVAFCRQRSFRPLAVEQTSQLATVRELVALGHGVSLIPAMAVPSTDDPRLVYRKVVRPKPTRTIAVATNAGRFRSGLLRELLARLADTQRARSVSE